MPQEQKPKFSRDDTVKFIGGDQRFIGRKGVFKFFMPSQGVAVWLKEERMYTIAKEEDLVRCRA